MEVTLLFFKRDLNIPLFPFTFDLHLNLPTIAADDEVGLFGLERFGAVEVASEGDLHSIRRRRLEGERQVDVPALVRRNRYVDRTFGVDERARLAISERFG